MPDQRDITSFRDPFDVVIVGGGPSGSSCAYWLARAGWSVCLIEKKQFPREKTCGDGLTPRSVHQLAQMGLEPTVAAEIAGGQLRVVLEPYAPEVPGLFLYFPSRAQVSPALKAFVDLARELVSESKSAK